MSLELTRRELIGALTGIVVCFRLAPEAALAADDAGSLPPMLTANPRLDAWIRIDPGGTVSIFSGRVELGQGNLTALAQIAAEELDVALTRIRMVPVDTARSPNEGVTAGSNSMQAGGAALRAAAADARAILLQAAAERLAVDPVALSVDDGTIRDGRDAHAGRQITYWQIATDLTLARDATPPITPKPANRHRIVGHSAPRLDIPAKAQGEPAFLQDLQLPGMLHGRVVRPPSYDAQLLAFDDAPVKALPDVIAVVHDGRFLGVVTRREEQAIAARDVLTQAARWRVPESQPAMASIYDYLQQRPDIEVSTVSEKVGPTAVVAKSVSGTYRKPYIAHASIGPSCAVAGMIDGVLTVWSHTQGPYPLRSELAKALALPLEKIRVIHAQGAGCYGHNGADDVALDAALLSLAAGGRPVRVQWMRDDEFAFEPYGSAMTLTARAGLSAEGRIVDWHYDLWSCTFNMRPGGRDGVNLLAAWHRQHPQPHATPREIGLPAGGGDRNAVPTYNFPNHRVVDHFIPDMPLRVSALRTLGGFGNVFAVESMMDEAAAAAGADPVEFRLRHLDDARAQAVMTAAAHQAGWKPGAKGDGTHGRGVAFCRYETTKCYVALVADCVVDRASGAVRVTRVVAAADAGQIINPDGLRNQIEGGIIQATSWTLKEAVRFDARGILSRDWASYPILTFEEVPDVEVILIDHPELPSLGAGEASSAPTAAAIANAIFNATGARVRELPFTPARVRSSLA